MTTLHTLKPDEIDEQWPIVEPFFAEAIEGADEPEFAAEDLKEMAKRGTALISYIADEEKPLMALAMEFIHYQRFKVLHVLAMSGERMKELFQEHSPFFAEFARSCGATHFQASGKPAQVRMFTSMQFYPVYQIVRFKL